MHIHIHIHIRVCRYLCKYMYTHTHTHVHTHTHTCIYIQTHIYTYVKETFEIASGLCWNWLNVVRSSRRCSAVALRYTKKKKCVKRDLEETQIYEKEMYTLTKHRAVQTLLCCCTLMWKETYVCEKRPQKRRICGNRWHTLTKCRAVFSALLYCWTVVCKQMCVCEKRPQKRRIRGKRSTHWLEICGVAALLCC